MHFVYLISIILLFATLAKNLLSGKIQFPKSWLFAILVMFILAQIISSVFSVDKFTSVFGYPSRLNGGLLSQISYLIIFTTALVNLNVSKAKKIILAAVLSSLAVSLWGIPGYFGQDPNCFVLTGKLNSSCWQKEFDPTLRIFSTIGQPNWLASYLALTLPLSITFALIYTNKRLKIFLIATSLIIFTALVMTNSRAGIIAIAVAFSSLLILDRLRLLKKKSKELVILGLGFILITLIFGTTLFSRVSELFVTSGKQNLPQDITSQTQQASPKPGGTESGIIRLIVWKGAIKAFWQRPILGWGPETFAYAYYQNRPAEHNKTTEWNFFYNKAHNEFLNYLTTSGIFGIILYISFIALVIYQLLRKSSPLISKTIAAAAIGYLTGLFFGFSVVVTQVLFFLLFASGLVLMENQKFTTINLPKNRIFLDFLLFITGLMFFISLSFPLKLYFADLFYSRAGDLASYNLNKAVSSYQDAINTFPNKNPFYFSNYAYTLAIFAQNQDDNKITTDFAQKADLWAKQAQTLSPNNIIVLRRVANAYLLISDLDNTYKKTAQDTADKIVSLAPTDPQSYLTLAKIQAGIGNNQKAKKAVETALQLKPDYTEALELLDQLNKLIVDSQSR